MKLLIAGIGNVFQADDGFGVEVARRLAARGLPDSVKVVDFGIRGFDLAFALLDETYERVLLVDLVQRGGSPGTLYLIEPGLKELEAGEGIIAQAHSMDPAKVLAWASSQGAKLDRVLILGCEPSDLGSAETVSMGLSPAVERAVKEAVSMAERWAKGELSHA